MVEQRGTIAVLRKGRELAKPFLDIRDRVRAANEEGLLSIAFDPGYRRNHRFYVYYVNSAGDIQVDGFKHKRGKPTRASERTRRTVIVIGHPGEANHNGGQLQFGPDGLLYLGTGDGGGGGDPGENAQDPESLLGKLLRIAPRGGGGYDSPSSNPFAAGAGSRRGLRARAAQPVAVLVRPRQRAPDDRRRRPGKLGGDRPPPGRGGRGCELRLGQPRGQPPVRGPGHRSGRLPSADPRVLGRQRR